MKYTFRRIISLVVTMLTVSFLAFSAFHIISGDPAVTILGTNATPERLEALRRQMGLDQPFLVQYSLYLLLYKESSIFVRKNARCMCQAFIGKVSFDERRVFKMQLPGLCPVYVYSKAHRLTAALA